MSEVKIRMSQMGFKNDQFEIDYTKEKKRVRKKVNCTKMQALMLYDLLNKAINQGYSKDDVVKEIEENSSYASNRDVLLREMDSLFFNTIVIEESTYEKQKTIMRDFLSIEDSDMVVNLLGKAGVGKSTIIQKMSALYEESFKEGGIKIPFTDLSRTTSYTADYRFVPKQDSYRFFAILKPIEELDVDVNECIDRATTRYFDGKLKGEDPAKLYNSVCRAFYSDSKNLFDIRYTVGRFYRQDDSDYLEGSGRKMLGVWEDIYGMVRTMCDEILGDDPENDPNYYSKLLSSEIRKPQSDYAELKRCYDGIVNFIFHLIENHEAAIKDRFMGCKSIQHLTFDNENSCVYGYITDFFDKEVQDFLKAFTAKSAGQFGMSYYNRMRHLRMELPYHPSIELIRKDFCFVMSDSIGISHSKNETGGFEDSTNLRLEGVDAILMVDDSRLNGDENFTALFEHIISRVDPRKIFFAYTFYDDLSKADLDGDDEKIEYLVNNTTSAINHSLRGKLFNDRKYNLLTNRLDSDGAFFLKGLKEPDDFVSLNYMLKVLASYKLTDGGKLAYIVTDTVEPMVVYDYKKIPLLYQSAVNDYYKGQDLIYGKNPPHFKTTEALTRRLMFGITYFDGARMLKPVDDFYDSLIRVLSPFLDSPELINFTGANGVRTDEIIEHVLGKIKTYVTETLRVEINHKFLSEKSKEAWTELYNLTGSGSDWERREGILDEEKRIGSNIDDYLRSSNPDHMVNMIERSIRDAIDRTADESGICPKRLFEPANHRDRIM